MGRVPTGKFELPPQACGLIIVHPDNWMETAMISTLAPLDWLQTLADPTRVRLLRLLEREELSVSELCLTLQLPQSTVSRHLKLLASEAWVSSRRDGTNH